MISLPLRDVTTRVERVFPYGALLRLPRLIVPSEVAYLHVSNYDVVYTDTLTDHLAQGEEVIVDLIAYDDKHNCFEASRSACIRRALIRQLHDAFASKSVVPASVCRLSEHVAIVRLHNGLLAFLGKSSLLELLTRASPVTQGSQVSVKITKVDVAKEKFDVEVSSEHQWQDYHWDLNQQYDAKVGLVDEEYAYCRIPEGPLIQCSVLSLRDPFASLAPGTKVSVTIKKKHPRGFWKGQIDTSAIGGVDIRNEFPPGKCVDAEVVRVSSIGVLCRLADGVLGFLHRTQIVTDRYMNINKTVHVGATLVVRVVDSSNPSRISLELVKQKTESDRVSKCGIIDLSSEKATRTVAAFARNAAFRANVLDAYNHTCAVCGMTMRITMELSAAEAAHILPKSSRGADDVQNALCLCKLHHWCFDQGVIAISRDHRIIVTPHVLGDICPNWLSSLRNRTACFPSDCQPDGDALAWHMRNVFLSG